MQPRKGRIEEADAVKTAEGHTIGAVAAWRRGSSGVSEQGMHTIGVHPGTWEALSSPCAHPGAGDRVTNPPGRLALRSTRDGANDGRCTVPPT